MSSQGSQVTDSQDSEYSQETSSQDSDSTWYPSESETESESEADTIPETDTFYDTQNDFKLLGELLNGSSSSNSQ